MMPQYVPGSWPALARQANSAADEADLAKGFRFRNQEQL
jgi:hypothetical protein